MNTTLRVGTALVAASVLVIGLGACSSNGNNTASSSVTVMPLPSDDGTSGIPTSTVTPTASTEPNTAAARLEIQVAGNQLKDAFGPVICVDEDADGDLDVDAGVDKISGELEMDITSPDNNPRLDELHIETPSVNIKIDDDVPGSIEHTKVTHEGNTWIVEGTGFYEADHSRTDSIFVKATCP